MSGPYGPRHKPRRLLRRDVSEAVEAAVDRVERADRLMSVNALSKLTGWDRGTIDAWRAKGCPVEREGGPGEPYELDIGKVWRWHVEQTKAEALKAAAASGLDGEGGFSWMGIREPKKAFDAQLSLMKVAEKAGELVMFDRLADVLERSNNAVRQAVMSIPDVIFREMGGFPEDLTKAWRRKALDQCRAALKGAEDAVGKALEAEPDDDAAA